MKRFLATIAVSLLLLSGCGQKQEFQIEDHLWQATSILQTEADGTVHELAEDFRLACTAQNGTLILENQSSGENWEGTYGLLQEQNGTTIYTLSLAGENGQAIVSETTYQDREAVLTLVVALKGYALYFQS